MEPDQVPSFLKLKQHQRKNITMCCCKFWFFTAVSMSSNQQSDSQYVQYYINLIKW